MILDTALLPEQSDLAKTDQANRIRSGSILHNMIQTFFGRIEQSWMQEVGSGIIYMIQPNSVCTLAIMTLTGHNRNTFESDLAWVLGEQHGQGIVPSSQGFENLIAVLTVSQPVLLWSIAHS